MKTLFLLCLCLYAGGAGAVITNPNLCEILRHNLERTSLSAKTIDNEVWACRGRAVSMRRALSRSVSESLRVRDDLKRQIKGRPYTGDHPAGVVDSNGHEIQ